MINVGIIGLGKMGKLHLMNCKHVSDIKITAVADTSKNNIDWAKRRGIPNLYSDYSELISKADVDAVIIALPHFLHVDSSILAMENGIDVFLEKPLANNVTEGKKIIDTANKKGCNLTIGCNCRFIESVEKIKKIYDDGIVGDVEIATLDNIGNGPFSPFLDPIPVPDWHFTPEQAGGGVLLDLGYHMIDLFQYFFKSADLQYASLNNRYNLPFEDSAIIILRSEKNHTKGVCNLGWFSHTIFPKFDFNITLHGTVDYISTKDLTPNIYKNAISESIKNIARKISHKKIKPLSYTYYYHSYYRELEYFFNHINSDKKSMIYPEESLKTLEIIEKAYNKKSKQENYES